MRGVRSRGSESEGSPFGGVSLAELLRRWRATERRPADCGAADPTDRLASALLRGELLDELELRDPEPFFVSIALRPGQGRRAGCGGRSR